MIDILTYGVSAKAKVAIGVIISHIDQCPTKGETKYRKDIKDVCLQEKKVKQNGHVYLTSISAKHAKVHQTIR